MLTDFLFVILSFGTHKEYCELIDQIKQALRRLDGQIKSVAFNNVRSELGIKELSHLDKLCEQPKRIKYNSLSKL